MDEKHLQILGDKEQEIVDRAARGETQLMILKEFEDALHTLLNDAIKGGLDVDTIHEVADAIVNNTFLDDDAEQ